MAVRPNFQNPVELNGDELIVSGQSEGDPLPVDVRVYIEQDGNVAGSRVQKLSTGWTATIPSQGFEAGKAFAFGVEIRKEPSDTKPWAQIVSIE